MWGQSTPFHMASDWGKTIALSSGVPLSPSYEAYVCQGIQPVLVRAGLGAQLGSFCMYPCPAEAARNSGSLTAPNRFPRTSHRQRLTLACIRVPSKRPRTNTPSGQFQTTMQQDPISFMNSISTGRSQQVPNTAEANCALCDQYLHCNLNAVLGVEPQSQPA